MRNLYLTAYHHVEMPSKLIIDPRERFIRYYNDLFHMEGILQPELSSYTKTMQYSYAELGDALFNSGEFQSVLSKIDLFVAAYWGHEFDPDGAFGAYFAHKYGITSRMFDVCDQGILSPISAINIIQAFVSSGKANKAALVCFDQTAIPVEHDFSGIFPSKNSACLMIFDIAPTSDSMCKIEAAHVKKNGTISETSSSIVIRPNSSYYSCAELFTPLLKNTNKANLDKTIDLVVIDSESDYQGILTLMQKAN